MKKIKPMLEVNQSRNGLEIQILQILLADRTSGTNILWCTENYIHLGETFYPDNPITIEQLSGSNLELIKPRVNKSDAEKKVRIKDKGEVFTPSWVCNKQINFSDSQWLGVDDCFNYEINGGWITNPLPIPFGTSKRTWKEYVKNNRLEISCGEAPYIASRYDTVSGYRINIEDRIGLLDRKIRVINENVKEKSEWLYWIAQAYMSVYGYEWQGDSLLIARENLFYSFRDYYYDRFNTMPDQSYEIEIAKIISWNLWQMDGLKGVIPNSCNNNIVELIDFFGQPQLKECPGCQYNDIKKHNGVYSVIKDWDGVEREKIIRFIDLSEGGTNK